MFLKYENILKYKAVYLLDIVKFHVTFTEIQRGIY